MMDYNNNNTSSSLIDFSSIVDFDSAQTVADSWFLIKSTISNYEQVAGELLFENPRIGICFATGFEGIFFVCPDEE